MKTISRAVVRGKSLDEDCKTTNVSKHEYGPNDNRCFCYGLYVPCNDWEYSINALNVRHMYTMQNHQRIVIM
jgi:hypothetical protein